MGLNSVERIFNNLDDWQELPAYQLERRADIFFATYLPEVLKGIKNINDIAIIPEFPLSKKALDEKHIYRDSVKVDYLVLNKEKQKVIFVELKTDIASFKHKQYQNMLTATNIGLGKFCQMIIELFPKQDFIKRVKYYHLLTKLNDAGLIFIPRSVENIMQTSNHRGITNSAKSIEVLENANNFKTPHDILYILPDHNPLSLPDTLSLDQQVTFEEFAKHITTKDELSLRFIKSLNKWRE